VGLEEREREREREAAKFPLAPRIQLASELLGGEKARAGKGCCMTGFGEKRDEL
jgi:hypothetical protein